MAGIVLSDSFTAAQPAAERRVLNRQWGGVPLPAGWRGRRTVVPPFHSSRAAILVALNGEARPTAVGSRLIVPSVAGTACCQRPGGRAMLLARGWVFNLLVKL